MVREINSPNGSPVPAGNNARVGARPAAETAGKASAAAGQSDVSNEHDPVKLSDSAQALQAMEQKLLELPEVNEQRVAEIKAALASGEYQVDDVVVADKLLAFENLFN